MTDQLSVEPVLEPVRKRHQLPQQKALVNLCNHCLHTGKIPFSVRVLASCPHAKHENPADQYQQTGILGICCRAQKDGECRHTGKMQQIQQYFVPQKRCELHRRYPIPRFVSTKSRTPRCSNFPRIRVMLTLSALSSIKT